MNSKKAWLGLAIVVLTFTMSVPRAALAQWSSSAIGVAEYDTDQTLLLLAGISGGPGGRGIHPRVGVQGYHLSYDAVTGRTNVMTIKPFVGLINVYEGGSLGANIGYSFSNRDAASNPGIIADRGDGLVVSGGWDYWGTGGPYAYQVLGSYHLGSESIWTRGRATRQLQQRANGQTRLGAEVAYLHGDNYSAWQPGAIMEFHGGSGRILGLGAGMKLYEGGNNAVYFKVEGYLPIGR